MTTSTLLHRSRTFAIALGAAVLTQSSFASANHETRETPDGALQTIVAYGDLRLDTDAGARELHRRITAAVHQVCPNYDPRNVRVSQAVRECRAQAMDRAIREIGSARLAALESSRRRVG